MIEKLREARFVVLLAIAILTLGVLGFVFGASTARAESYTTTKYDTTFTYLGDNQWTVQPHGPNAALHNIGPSNPSWICAYNNVGTGVDICRTDWVYKTNGDIYGDRSCVYIQGDTPAWDTVPNTEKEVCAPLSPPTPTEEPSVPTPTETVEPSPEPSVTPTESPSPEPSETPTTEPTPEVTPTPEPTTTPAPTPEPTPTETATPTPEPSVTPEVPVVTPEPEETTPVVVPEPEVPVAEEQPPAETQRTFQTPEQEPVTDTQELAETGMHDGIGIAVGIGIFLLIAGVIAWVAIRIIRSR